MLTTGTDIQWAADDDDDDDDGDGGVGEYDHHHRRHRRHRRQPIGCLISEQREEKRGTGKEKKPRSVVLASLVNNN